MRVSVVLCLLSFATSARAEVAKLGDFSLGQAVTKPKTTTVTIFGCTGDLRPGIKGGKVAYVTFESSDCKLDTIAAQLTKEYGAKPIETAAGVKLWEGKTASIILDPDRIRSRIELVAPGPGAKRVCWADDGFTAFWQTFKDSLATNKPAKIAGSFAFPVRDFDGKSRIKDAKAFAKKWKSVLSASDIKAIQDGELEPACDYHFEHYRLPLEDSNAEIEAHKVGDTWKWTQLNDVASG